MGTERLEAGTPSNVAASLRRDVIGVASGMRQLAGTMGFVVPSR